jgi:hypothetical protein
VISNNWEGYLNAEDAIYKMSGLSSKAHRVHCALKLLGSTEHIFSVFHTALYDKKVAKDLKMRASYTEPELLQVLRR